MRETVTQLQMVTIAHASKDSKDPTAIVSKHAVEKRLLPTLKKEPPTQNRTNTFLPELVKKKHSREPSPRKSTEGSTFYLHLSK